VRIVRIGCTAEFRDHPVVREIVGNIMAIFMKNHPEGVTFVYVEPESEAEESDANNR